MASLRAASSNNISYGQMHSGIASLIEGTIEDRGPTGLVSLGEFGVSCGHSWLGCDESPSFVGAANGAVTQVRC